MKHDKSLHGDLLKLTQFDSDYDFQVVFDRHAHEIMYRMVDCVDIAYNLKLDMIPVLTIFNEAGIPTFDVDLYPDQFIEKLNVAGKYFIGTEDYEMCARIKDITDRIS